MDGSHLGLFQIPSISKAVLENLNTKGIDFKAIRSVDVETLLRMDRHHIGGGHLRFFSNWSNIVDFPGEPYNMKPYGINMKQVCSVELAILAWMNKTENYLSWVAGRHLGFFRIRPKFELGLYFTSIYSSI